MNDLATRLARFAGALRSEGLPATVRDEIDAVSALSVVDRQDRDEVRLALRVALKVRRPAYDAFERLFAAWWSGATPSLERAAPERPEPRRPARVLRWDPDARRLVDGAQGADALRPSMRTGGYSPEALLRRKSFEDVSLSSPDLVRMERLLARLARRFAARRGRRWVATRSRGRPDLRASFYRALRTTGEVVTFARRARDHDRPRLTFLCDTSGSMEGHTRFLLTFILSLRRVLPGSAVFAFNTELVKVPPGRARGDLRRSLDRIAAAVPDWSGGTRIGDCLAAFVQGHLGSCVDAKTVVVIVSDGLDRGDPSVLVEALRAIERRARRIVWLNPLMGDPDYEPLARAIRAAMPFVQAFAPAHSIESLERALLHLTRPT